MNIFVIDENEHGKQKNKVRKYFKLFTNGKISSEKKKKFATQHCLQSLHKILYTNI